MFCECHVKMNIQNILLMQYCYMSHTHPREFYKLSLCQLVLILVIVYDTTALNN